MRWFRLPRLIVFVLLALVVASGAVPASAQSQGEVDEAKAEREAALTELRARQDEERFVDDELTIALQRYEEVNDQLEGVAARIAKLEDRVATYETEVAKQRAEAKDLVLEAYMAGGFGDLLFDAETFEEVVAGQEVSKLAAERATDIIKGFGVVKRDMERVRTQVQADEAEIEALIGTESAVVSDLSGLLAMRADQTAEANAELAAADSEYREAVRAWEAEQLRRRLAEVARRTGAAGGVGKVDGITCPVAGPTAFIDSWGFPRSGGRTHKGTDMFAARGTPLVAVDDGTVLRTFNSLGGNNVWIVADHGIAYYYAHLDSFASSAPSGSRVSHGQTVGYVGNSGNARGTSPHLHIQMHPGGRGASPVNPYSTMVHACG